MSVIRDFYDSVIDPMCSRLLLEIPHHYKYHSLRHTLDVIEQSLKIGQAEGLTGEDIDILKVAALFHDSGYLIQRQKHEEMSCLVFREMSFPYSIPSEVMKRVEGCIMATSIPQKPHNLLEKVICDADLDYLGRDDFDHIAHLLFEEFLGCGEVKNVDDWNRIQLSFLSKHAFHTDYAITLRTPRLKENIELIRTLVKG